MLIAGCGSSAKSPDQARQELTAARAQIEQERQTAQSQITTEQDTAKTTLRGIRQQIGSARGNLQAARKAARTQSRTLARLKAQVGGVRAQIRRGTIPGTGTFLVGKDIEAGTYRAAAKPGCFWERQSSLDQSSLDSIADNDNADGPVVVVVSPADAAFKTDGCADFHKIG